jgi:hypothetical protein
MTRIKIGPRHRVTTPRLLFGAMFLLALIPLTAAGNPTRQRTRLDDQWKFTVGDPANAQDPTFSDDAGPIELKAHADGLADASVTLQAQ